MHAAPTATGTVCQHTHGSIIAHRAQMRRHRVVQRRHAMYEAHMRPISVSVVILCSALLLGQISAAASSSRGGKLIQDRVGYSSRPGLDESAAKQVADDVMWSLSKRVGDALQYLWPGIDLTEGLVGSADFVRTLAGYDSMRSERPKPVAPEVYHPAVEVSPEAMEDYLSQTPQEALGIAGHGRRLAAPTNCSTGKAIPVRVTIYTCGGNRVDQQTYAQRVAAGATNCQVSQITEEGCACPVDRTGPNCLGFRATKCAVMLEDDAFDQCAASLQDSSYAGYNPRIEGTPPCLRVKPGQLRPLTFRLACNFTDMTQPKCNGTGITTAQQATGVFPFYSLTDCVESKFKYWIEQPGALYVSARWNTRLQMRVTNFVTLESDTYVSKVSLNVSHFMGHATVNTNVSTSALPTDLQVTGRIYAAATLTPLPAGLSASGAVLAVDIEGYEQPPFPGLEKRLTPSVIVWLCVIAVAICWSVWWCYVRCDRRGKLKES